MPTKRYKAEQIVNLPRQVEVAIVEIFARPNVASSGRFDAWSHFLSIISDNPQYLVFGIGYKTLTFTRLFHEEIIVDNGYLSLLLERGLAGFLFRDNPENIFQTLARQGRRGSDPVGCAFFLLVRATGSTACCGCIQLLAQHGDLYSFRGLHIGPRDKDEFIGRDPWVISSREFF